MHHTPPVHTNFFMPSQRLDAAGPFFFIFGLREPRGSVRLGFGGRFDRASRFNFLRSALSAIFRVFISFL